jgi:hypothetical protein
MCQRDHVERIVSELISNPGSANLKQYKILFIHASSTPVTHRTANLVVHQGWNTLGGM